MDERLENFFHFTRSTPKVYDLLITYINILIIVYRKKENK